MYGRDVLKEIYSLHNTQHSIIHHTHHNNALYEQATQQQLALAHVKAQDRELNLIKQHGVEEAGQNAQLQRAREDKAEDNRKIIYHEHMQLIDDAMTLSFFELEKRIHALAVLEEPIERFQQAHKKGIPLKNERTLFYVILKNTTISLSQKFYLYDKLLKEKGYNPYFNIFLRSPAIDLILSDNNNTNLLLQLFHKFNQLHLLREELTKTQIMNWPLLTVVHQRAGLDANVVTECFERWASSSLKDIATFVNTYIQFLRINPNLKLNENIWKRVLVENEVEGNRLYLDYQSVQNANARFSVSENCMLVLSIWVQAYNLQHDFSLVKNHYLGLVRSNRFTRVLDNEETVWIKLLQCDNASGTELFEALVNHLASEQKLLKFIETWVNVLDNDNVVRNTYSSLEPHLRETSIQSYKAEIKNIIGLRLQLLLKEKKPLSNDKENQKWLKKTRPLTNFFRCCCSSTKDGYEVYAMIRNNKPGAETALREEKQNLEDRINDKLTTHHQQEKFQFRKT